MPFLCALGLHKWEETGREEVPGDVYYLGSGMYNGRVATVIKFRCPRCGRCDERRTERDVAVM